MSERPPREIDWQEEDEDEERWDWTERFLVLVSFAVLGWFALFVAAGMLAFMARMIWISLRYGWDLAP